MVREAYHRILSAFAANDIAAPRGVPTINFAPAHLRKTGSGFDLPMALALAGAAGLFPVERAANLSAMGELTLEGEDLQGVDAILSGCRGGVYPRPLRLYATTGRDQSIPYATESRLPRAAYREGHCVFITTVSA